MQTADNERPILHIQHQLKMLFANFMGVVLLTAVYCQQSLPLFEHEGLGLSNNSFI